MMCQKCKYHFCWMCMGKFGAGSLGDNTGYSTHKCNTYSKKEGETLDKDFERLGWHSERYELHLRSLKFEKK